MCTDYEGKFPVLAVTLLAGLAVAGGVFGGIVGNNQSKKDEDESSSENNSVENSNNAGETVAGVAIGASIGIATAGTILILTGAGVTVAATFPAAIVGWLGMSGPQTVALGMQS